MTEACGGHRFCGAVQAEATGEAEAMGYCRCRFCRSWPASSLNASTLWKPRSVRVTAEAEHIATFSRADMSYRQFCRFCGGHVMTVYPTLDMIDVYAATIVSVRDLHG